MCSGDTPYIVIENDNTLCDNDEREVKSILNNFKKLGFFDNKMRRNS